MLAPPTLHQLLKASVIANNVASDITQETTDHHELIKMVEVVEQNLGALPKEASADAGYSSY